jgi:single-strand DNA-binding protein
MVNKVLLVGRLCTDPELKYTPSGVAVANFRIAVDRTFTNAQGERETDFIDVVAWRQSAEFVDQYLGKGRLILVDGRLQVRQWQTADGQRRRSTEVVADSIRALDRPREARDGEMGEAPRHAGAPSRAGGGRHRDDDMMPEPPGDYDGGGDLGDIMDPFADQA